MPESNEIREAIAANGAFYQAFAAGDFASMQALWARTTPVICVHPGESPIHGRGPVMESWRGLLEDPPAIRASGAQVAVVRGLAFVTCLEHIGDGVLAATNVFVWEDGAWRLAHHHAGPVQPAARADTGARGPLH